MLRDAPRMLVTYPGQVPSLDGVPKLWFPGGRGLNLVRAIGVQQWPGQTGLQKTLLIEPPLVCGMQGLVLRSSPASSKNRAQGQPPLPPALAQQLGSEAGAAPRGGHGPGTGHLRWLQPQCPPRPQCPALSQAWVVWGRG